MRMTTARPPTTPPTMTPIGDFCGADVEVVVIEGGTVVGELVSDDDSIGERVTNGNRVEEPVTDDG